ncbi:MAG: BolA/IbaG family iron-sulfur metabolism protein [Alphaproteobacteria bacterium]|nr:BolA/IbaG family iron-sulfur metabolism protein [Alphaproteobacteria bacterium]
MASNADKIKEKLAPLAPTLVEIEDETARHHGHAGHSGGAMTHLKLKVVSAAFAGQSRLARQRMVMDLLKSLWADTNLHALSLEAKAPAE